jgi:hypothetical protein
MLHAALSRMSGGGVGRTRHALTRDALVSSVGDYVARSCPSATTLIVVDDAHWLDPLSALVVDRLCSDGRCAVLVSARPDPVAHMSALVERHQVLDLGPLSPDDIAALAHRALGTLADRLDVERVWTRTGGNPLFATLLLDMVREGQRLDDELPTAVRVVVQQRLGALSHRAAELVRFASVLGTVVDLDILTALVPSAAALTEVMEAGVLRHGEHPDVVEFDHSLLAEVAYASIPEGRRIALHDTVGELLLSVGAGAVEVARHLEIASALDPLRAAQAHLGAAAELAAVYDWDRVEEHALAGLAHVDPHHDETAARLAVLLGRSQRSLHRGHPEDVLIAASEFARRGGDAELFADAVAALAVHTWSTSDGASDTVHALYADALACELPTDARTRLCAIGATFMASSRHRQARAVYRKAIELADTLGDPTIRAEVLRLSRWGFIHPADLADLQTATAQLAEIAGHDPDLRWGVAGNRYCLGTIGADIDTVTSAVAEMWLLHDQQPGAPRLFEVSHMQLGLDVLSGRLDAAEAGLDEVLRLGLASNSRQWVLPIYLAASVAVRRRQGRLEELTPLVAAGVAERGDFVGWRVVAAAVAAAAGQLDTARRELDAAAADDFGRIIPDSTWTTVMVLLADAALAVGDLPRCRAIATMLAPYSERMTWSGVSTCGSIAATLSDLHTALGDDDAAASHAATAATLLSRLRG